MLTKTFVLDAQLDKLARNLRMVGFDSAWNSLMTNEEAIHLSQNDHRTLLTTQLDVLEKADASLRYRVQAVESGAQLVEVLTQFKLLEQVRNFKGFFSRCLDCNSPLVEVSEKQIADHLPAHVQETQKEFYFCTRCERVYSKGAHYERMKTWISGLLLQN